MPAVAAPSFDAVVPVPPEAPPAPSSASAVGAGAEDGVGSPETVAIEGRSISAEELTAAQARVEESLSMESILGGSADPGGGLGIGGVFAGEGGAVAGLQGAVAGGPGDTVAGADAGEAAAANAVPAPRGRIRTAGGAPAGGSGRMSADVFRTTLGRKRGAIEACYNNALANDSSLTGDLTFLITAGVDGAVNVAVEQDAPSLQAAGVTSCVAAKLQAMNFTSSPPQGGEFLLRLPISFLLPEA